MLTVQPKFTNYVAPKAVSFKADFDDGEDLYKEKVNYYKKQSAAFKELCEDSSNPDSFKKIIKVFGIASEALLEGWAVAWGASKGSKILKSSIISGSKSKFVKGAGDILKPVYTGIETSAKKISEKTNKLIEKIKTTKFAEKCENFVEKMRNNTVGKYVVKGFEYVAKAFKYVSNILKSAAKKAVEPLKNKSKSEMYDKTAKVTSNTLGVGAGVAGAYNAATGADKRQADADSEVLEPDYMGEE